MERKPGIDRRNRSVLERTPPPHTHTHTSPPAPPLPAATTKHAPFNAIVCVTCWVASAGETQIMRAVHDADMAKVKVLIADGADVNIACNAGWTPLHESGNPEITTLLLEAEADPNVRQP